MKAFHRGAFEDTVAIDNQLSIVSSNVTAGGFST